MLIPDEAWNRLLTLGTEYAALIGVPWHVGGVLGFEPACGVAGVVVFGGPAGELEGAEGIDHDG